MKSLLRNFAECLGKTIKSDPEDAIYSSDEGRYTAIHFTEGSVMVLQANAFSGCFITVCNSFQNNEYERVHNLGLFSTEEEYLKMKELQEAVKKDQEKLVEQSKINALRREAEKLGYSLVQNTGDFRL